MQSKAMVAGDRVERDVAAMIPGRTWTWALNAEQSRKQLGQLGGDLQAFWAAEQAYEQSLPTKSAQRVQAQLSAIHQLFQHLQADARSLDEELSKGTPTRWHVNKDVLDMQKEIQRWRRLHQTIAARLG